MVGTEKDKVISMKWGTFTTTHIVTLVLAVVLLVAIYYILRKTSQKVQIWVLGILSFSGIVAIIYNLAAWGEPLEYLPFHLCSVNALVLPIAVFTRSKTLGNLLLVWCLGALAALILNHAVTDAEILGAAFNIFYFPHVLEFGIPIIMVKLGLLKKDPKCIGSTLAITMGVYTAVHFINLALNAWAQANQFGYSDAVFQANYMYSLEPTNPLLQLFYSILPYPYWYMYLIVPIVFAYLVIVYLPELIALAKGKAINT